jgi:hypothetical protein
MAGGAGSGRGIRIERSAESCGKGYRAAAHPPGAQ